MADNFNLRTFLTENKLTTSSRILNENVNRNEEQLLSSFSDPKTGISPIDMQNFIKSNSGKYIYNYFEPVDDIDEKLEVTPEQALAIVLAMNGKGEIPASLPQGYDARLYFSNNETNLDEEAPQGSDISGYWVMYGEPNKGIKQFIKMFSSEQEAQQALEDAPAYYGQHVLRSNWGIEPAQDWLGSGKELGPDLMGHPDRVRPKQLSPEEKAEERIKFNQYRQDMYENKLTTKERRLVEMVQDALGIQREEEAPFGTNKLTGEPLPDPASQMVVEDDMVQEKPLPKYNSIEELMKEIEHGTNEAAHKYKMDEMKRVYEALEAKVGSLEEGEHAEHIDQKAVKQMRKDIAALRKAEEKLRKEFDKKFSGKEKKGTPVKEKATEALQEGFDLRKFLVENKLTAGSKLVSENEEQVDELFGFGRKKYKEGDLVFYKDEKEPRKISRVFDNKGTTMYDLSTLEQNGVFFKNGGYNASDAELKPAK
jgi:hypothetical protein